MSVYKLDPETSDESKKVPVEDSKPTESGEGESTPAESKPKTKQVVLDGPLSSIYTKALNIVYSQESSANDHLKITDIMADEVDRNANVDLYVYATDTDSIDKNELPVVFNNLRVALDKNKNSTVVAVECNGKVTTNQAILEEYLYGMGIKTLHKRDRATAEIKSRIDKLYV